MSTYTHLDFRLRDSTASRAWCFQESILPSRALNYSIHEARFRCRDHQRLERTPTKEIDLAGPLLNMKYSALIREYDKTTDQYRNIMDSWYYIVEEYSRRRLTFSKDKLPAISGIASLLGDATHDRYLAGRWGGEPPAALCWHSFPKNRYRKCESYVAPSWSWASYAGPVYTYLRGSSAWRTNLGMHYPWLQCSQWVGISSITTAVNISPRRTCRFVLPLGNSSGNLAVRKNEAHHLKQRMKRAKIRKEERNPSTTYPWS
jgi:hypothetical protein